MIRKAIDYDDFVLRDRTINARWRVTQARAYADQLSIDPEKTRRHAEQRCIVCYYGSGFGGAAITSQPCAGCGEVFTYGSTNTDAFCKPCAQARRICKHCGADIDLDTKRKTIGEPT
jgi:hypothetical protein